VLVACFCAAGLVCLGLGAPINDTSRWVVLGAGVLAVMCGCLVGCYAAFFKADLLRSTEDSVMPRFVDMLDDDELDAEIRKGVLGALTNMVEPIGPKRTLSEHGGVKGHDDG
jgi:hypothetical protein